MPLQFHRPESVAEAVELHARPGARACFLAGGTELNRGAGSDAEQLISLQRLQLDRIESSGEGLAIGACCTIQRLLDAEQLPAGLRAAAAQLPSRTIRNMATLGGQIAGQRRCADLVPALVALEAQVEVAAVGGARVVPLLEYVQSSERPLVTRVRLGRPDPARSVAVGRESRNANGTALVTGAVALTRGGAPRPIVALCGVAPRVVRLSGVERALSGASLPPAEELERQVAAELPALADEGGASGLTALLAAVLVARLAARAEEGLR